MIAILKGIKYGSLEDVLNVVLIDMASNNLENGIQIHEEMLKLDLAVWKPGNDSGYNSSHLNYERMPGGIAESEQGETRAH